MYREGLYRGLQGELHCRQTSWAVCVLLVCAPLVAQRAAPAGIAVKPGEKGLATARVKGLVADSQGGIVPGAQVVVSCRGGGEHPTESEERATTDAAGEFEVAGLTPGECTLTVSSAGLETLVLRNVNLTAGETYMAPGIALPIANAHADVTVTVTTEQIAEDELHEELKQRVFGVFPNFYTSYDWTAAPLNARQKFKLTFRASADPVMFGTTAAIAGAEQINNTFPEYGGGFPGYASRYGAAYGDAVIGRFLGSALFASVFRQDPRYFVMGTGTIKARTWHAVSSTFIQRGDNGRWQPGYSHLLGNACAGLIATTYHPDSTAGKLVLDNTVLALAGEAGANLTREFILRHFAHHLPGYDKGKPPKE